MPNMLDYLEWRGDLTLEQSPFCQVDNLILSQLAYVPMDGIVPEEFDQRIRLAEAAERFLSLPFAEKRLLFQEDKRLLATLAVSPRFRDMELTGYASTLDFRREEQFAALTVRVAPEVWFVAYRGTDTTIAGWKEDVNMSFLTPVPAQTDAVAYLHRMAEVLEGELILGGHSKGGNLAVYAGVFCREEIQRRILRIYNNDGPGFLEGVTRQEPFQRMQERIETYLPQSAVVGMLLEHQENYSVVDSDKMGLLQHDAYSWQVRRDSFIRLEEVSPGSYLLDKTLTNWLSGLTAEERETFVETLFSLLEKTGARTLQDLTGKWHLNVKTVLEAMEGLEPEMRKMLQHTFTRLLKSAGRSVAEYIKAQAALRTRKPEKQIEP